ncbi:MAG: alkaline phosphatase family protein [Candidatus Cybelea sp.]
MFQRFVSLLSVSIVASFVVLSGCGASSPVSRSQPAGALPGVGGSSVKDDRPTTMVIRGKRTALAAQVPHFNHVFLIIGENTSARDVNQARMPYLVGTLMPQGGSLTNYEALHSGSLSDYIGMIAGHYTRCDVNDSLPYNPNTNKPTCIDAGPSIFSLLDKAKISWKEWNESMPNPCGFFDMGTDWAYNIYTTHHNPAVYFTDIEGARYFENFDRAPNLECLQRVLPMGSTAPNDTSAFEETLSTGAISKFNMIIPNGCEDSHDHCGARDRLTQFDTFLAREVPKILASPAFGSDGAVFITFDEWGDFTPHDKRVAFVAIGPRVLPGSVNAGHYNHYSLLRTLEDGYRLRPYLGGAAKAATIKGIWGD